MRVWNNPMWFVSYRVVFVRRVAWMARTRVSARLEKRSRNEARKTWNSSNRIERWNAPWARTNPLIALCSFSCSPFAWLEASPRTYCFRKSDIEFSCWFWSADLIRISLPRKLSALRSKMFLWFFFRWRTSLFKQIIFTHFMWLRNSFTIALSRLF